MRNVTVWYPCVFSTSSPASSVWPGGRAKTAENMELSDGLLLQVNNGEQWCNRWKHPNDDSVSHRPRSTLHLLSAITGSASNTLSDHSFILPLALYMLHRTGPFFMCDVFFFNLQWFLFEGPQHQPLSAALCCQHVEGGPAEQKETLCGPLLSLLYTTELGNVTPQLINSQRQFTYLTLVRSSENVHV